MSKLIKFRLAILFSIIWIVGLCWYISYVQKWGRDQTYCGIIIKKIVTQGGNYKHFYDEQHFIIKFEGVDNSYDLRPTLNDWGTKEEGDYVCYDLTPAQVIGGGWRHNHSKQENILMLGMIGGLMLLFITLGIWWYKF